MASISETSIATNVANFEVLISAITAFGTNYNPSKEIFKLPALLTLLGDSKTSLNAVNIAHSSYSN
ncbi:MAG: hypothetical protein PHS59_18070, partial [Paludibacter sp.]|nr:hypothetical protein [Paludibacter sp.]